ncbi:zinc-binding dehydrogenase [Oricola nitratireducens]|uniref:zinc-binding dehydrogenase n=1 Tax=Oricola nitratireducens TaxID=2775868 RepID=UPI0018690451|nr:zinc-binding dehydrogenase [Oricola nitratireducens]
MTDITFKAAVLDACTTDRPFTGSKPLKLETVSVGAPESHEVLVRIDAASLCRSDLSVITGVRAWPMPIVPGHEASGTVVETGSDVTRFAPGDRVVLVYQPQCGACPCCIAGDAWLCEPGLASNRAGELLDGGVRLSWKGERLHHHMGLSAFAEMAVVSEHSLVRVDRDLDPQIAALFGCAVLCGAGSVINTGGVRPGETVAIAGIGGVGASAILGARLAGARRIVAVDPDPEKRETALSLGATDAVPAGPDAAAQILEMTHGGVDCALETAGQLEAFQTAYGAARRGGRVVTVGLVSPKTPFALDVAAHVTSAKSVTGSYMGSCNPLIDIPKFVDLYRRGHFPVDRLITARMPLEEVNTALEEMAASRALRQILTP